MIRRLLFALLTCLFLAGSVHSQVGKDAPAKGVTITVNPDGTITIGTGQQKQNLIPLTDEQINALRVLQSIKLPEIPKKDVLTPKPTVNEKAKIDDVKEKKDPAKDKKDPVKDKDKKDPVKDKDKKDPAKDKDKKDPAKDKDKKDPAKKDSARLDAIEKDLGTVKDSLAEVLAEVRKLQKKDTVPEPKTKSLKGPQGPLVVVKLPPNHEKVSVYFDGAKTKSEGLVREYRSDIILSSGETYYYQIAAIIQGKIQTRDAVVRNNATTTVDFTLFQ